MFHGLKIAPVMTRSPDGSLGFSFRAGHAPSDVDATLEHLLELPAQLAADRRRRSRSSSTSSRKSSASTRASCR